MNESYAVLYQEFLMEPRTKEAADSIAQKMFTHRLYFDDKKVRYVIVRHSQIESEETYTCVPWRGRARCTSSLLRKP